MHIAVAQVGPIARSDTRARTVARLCELLKDAASRGAKWVTFPELTLTTFFPRWSIEDPREVRSFFETEMPGKETRPLFDLARELGVGFYLGYAELDGERQFNTSILVDGGGSIIGKYRKIHIPGDAQSQDGYPIQHLEKKYFQVGDLGFPVFDAGETRIGMCICNDRRWPETYRVMSLQAVDLVMVGYNTPTGYGRLGEPRHLPLLHNHLSLQAAAYQNTCWVAAAAKAGVEEGIHMIGGSCIVAPTGEIAVQALSEDDEVINYVCDMSLADGYRGNIFNYERHRRPEHYRAIVDRVGASRSPL
ncbi:N-carbamoyl-D-amino-acid hydrolase [Parapusillimonas granuli]|uniref:N-carbamoyl-D-amino-acid hydrolase n=1 Tax=Parapusillimonas granuli TaxID=380911 RepID=A0A853G1Y1_9BURK|nr:N-carbamoyl-D-amino-acid hydrolase [Parapusillimonas granuli]